MSFKVKNIISAILLIILIFFVISRSSLSTTKVLLIGIDGATWSIIDPMVNEGKLPNIKKLTDNGSYGALESFDPLTSEVVWTSIATGKPPAEHGITDRLLKDPDTGELVPVTSNLRNTKAIWNILSEHKKKSSIVGYQCTWPPEKINGVMISIRANNTVKYLSRDYSYPPFEMLCSKQEFESFSLDKNSIFSRIETGKFNHFAANAEEQDNFMVNFFKNLLQKQKFDFYCLYIQGIDKLSHFFWKYMLPESYPLLPKEDIEKYKDIIKDYYIRCDGIIGDILKLADKNTIVIICSDHGFKTDLSAKFSFLKVEHILELIGLNEAHKNSKVFSVTIQEDSWWRSTQYFKITGNLSVQELEEVKKDLKNVFNHIEVKETGQQVFQILEDTKTGFAVNIDMVAINKNPENHILIKNKEYKLLDLLTPNIYSGTHDKYGIILISGKNIQHNKIINKATIYDITPTILYLMNLPIGTDMKGKVLVETINKELFIAQPVKYIKTYDTVEKEKKEKPIRSPKDEEKIKELMRSLGYIN